MILKYTRLILLPCNKKMYLYKKKIALKIKPMTVTSTKNYMQIQKIIQTTLSQTKTTIIKQ
jgi:hypothetical protein